MRLIKLYTVCYFIDLDLSTEETFVQRYVDKPLLVDKK